MRVFLLTLLLLHAACTEAPTEDVRNGPASNVSNPLDELNGPDDEPTSLVVQGRLDDDTDEFKKMTDPTLIAGTNLTGAYSVVVDYFLIEDGQITRKQFSVRPLDDVKFPFVIPKDSYAVATVGGLEVLVPPMNTAPKFDFLFENKSKKAAEIFEEIVKNDGGDSILAANSLQYSSVLQITELLAE